MTTEPRTEAQMRIAAMLVALEQALGERFPGRVSSTGTLWQRRIAVWINDLEEMVIDFTAETGIRVRINRADKHGDSGDSKAPEADLTMVTDAGMDDIDGFIRDMVTGSADALQIDPRELVYIIADIATNTARLQQAAAALEPPAQPPGPELPPTM